MIDARKLTPSKTLLSIAIALTAVSGALISWQAARVGGEAGSADGQAITAALDEASTEMGIASDAFANLVDTREFTVHMENAKAINEEYLHNPDVPPHWLGEWQSEAIRARARHTQLNTDFLAESGGRVTFDRRRYHDTMRATTATEKALDPDPFVRAARDRRRASRALVDLNVLFTAAIFLFTVAVKTDVRRKAAWAAAGLVLYAVAAGSAVVRIFL